MHLTWQRISNLCRARWNFFLSRWGVYRFTHRPTFLAIEPIDICMLRCPQCPTGQAFGAHSATKIDKSLFSRLLAEQGNTLLTMLFHFQGEPTLNADLPWFIAQAHQRGIYTLFSTNGQSLSPAMAQQLVSAGVDRVIVSVDGVTQAAYEQYRVGGSLSKVLAAVRALRKARTQAHSSTPHIEIQCLRLRSNEAQWELLRQQYRQWGGDSLTLKKAQFYDYEQGNPLMPTRERDSRYRKDNDGRYRLKAPLHNRCWRLWSGAVVTAKGELLPCCFDKAATFSYGNLHRAASFAELWSGPQATAFRQHLLQRRADIEICTNCTE